MNKLPSLNVRADASRFTIQIEDYPKLVMEARQIKQRYLHLVTNPKDARKQRTQLNKLKRSLNQARLRYKRAYIDPGYKDFKSKIDALIADIDEASQAMGRIAKKDQQRRKKRLADGLMKDMREICQSRKIEVFPVPKEALKSSLSHHKRIEIMANDADIAAADLRKQYIKPIGNHIVDTQSGEIISPAEKVQLTVHDSPVKVAALKKFIQDNHIHAAIN